MPSNSCSAVLLHTLASEHLLSDLVFKKSTKCLFDINDHTEIADYLALRVTLTF